MTWRFRQSTGDLWHDGSYEGRGYSGHGPGVNNPAMEADQAVGPIPAGHWNIGPAHTSPHTGPITMNLDPVGFDPHGRTLFRIHGDTAAQNHTASHGCIILGRPIRRAIADSGDTELQVIP